MAQEKGEPTSIDKQAGSKLLGAPLRSLKVYQKRGRIRPGPKTTTSTALQ